MYPVITDTTSATTTCTTSSVTTVGTTTPLLAPAPLPAGQSNILVGLRDRCSYYTCGQPTEIIAIIFCEYVFKGDIQSFAALSCVNAHCFVTSRDQILKGKSIIPFFCPNLTILDAKAQGLECNNEPPISLKLVSEYSKLAPFVEGNAGLTLVTVTEDLTLNQVVVNAEKDGIKVVMGWDEILKQLGDKAVVETYRALITNAPVINTRTKKVEDVQGEDGEMIKGQKTVVCEAGFDGLPTPIEYLLVIVHTQKISGKCLYGQEPSTFGRTSICVNGVPLVVGGSATGRVNVSRANFFYDRENYGAGGQRK